MHCVKQLAKKGFDPLMGARPMQRLIQDTIRRALADELLFGRLVDGGRAHRGRRFRWQAGARYSAGKKERQAEVRACNRLSFGRRVKQGLRRVLPRGLARTLF